MSFLGRVKALFGIEGSHRGPFSGMGELGGIYGIEPIGDGWQRNLSVDGYGARHVPGVYACVMLVARSISQCYPRHVREADGGFTDVTTSAAFRVLRNPNRYSTAPDFLLNLVAMSLFDGESFALATRNDRNEITSLHLLPRGSCSPMVDDETREVFYSIGANPLAPGGTDYIAPQRDILHLRYHTPRHPLIGESALKAAAMAIGINVALSATQQRFFSNMNRPSGILSTDVILNREQITRLREAFDEQSRHMANGRMPILGGGLKFQPLSVNSVDAQLIEAQRMSLEDICRVFGVPPPLVGDLSHATLNNSETLVHHFMAQSLGAYLEHIERAFDRLFGLPANEYIELDASALLRTDFAGRIDGLTKAVQNGLMTPDEARQREGLGKIEGGSTAYLQRQMVPIDKIGELLDAEAEAKTQQPAPAPEPEPAPEPKPEEGKSFDPEVGKALVAQMIRKRVAA